MSVLERVPLSLRHRLPRTGRAGRWMLAGSAAAWVALLPGWLLRPADGSGAHIHSHGAAPTAGLPSVEPWSLAWAGGWLLMVAAMMWPLLVPTADRVVRSAFPTWRLPLTFTAVATSTALWLALGLAAASVAQLARVPAGSQWWQLAFLLVAAAAWGSARRARLLWRCGKLPPAAPCGLRGVRDAALVGVLAWRRCATLCGPLMIAMVLGHNPVVLVAASLSVWWEARHPRAWRDPVPLSLLGVAGLGVLGEGLLAS